MVVADAAGAFTGFPMVNRGYYSLGAQAQPYSRPAYKASHAFRDRSQIDGFDHPRKVFDPAEELIRRRYPNDNIKAVLGGNFRGLLGATRGPESNTGER
jgi:membrane dipeptidase